MSNGPPSPPATPQYARIAADLREKIRNGTYGPGALLPSRNEIIADYGVSAITARDALAMISHEGYARAVRGRGHIVRRKRSRMTLPGQLYATREPDPAVPLELSRLDVYQETPPDNIALPLETAADSVWVRRAV
jgi:DNA-binding GntR family transcriptional regulator